MKINGETLICASLGNPNKASMAPTLHNAGFEALSLNYIYTVFEPDDIGKAMDAVRAFKMPGVSITSPFKQDVMEHLDELDPTAKAIGAVNCVHNQDGKLTGYNCDWIGAVGALEEATELKGKKIAVLGAGGAARAVVYGLNSKGADVTVYNRTAEKGEALAKDMGVSFGGELDKVQELKPEILVNCTKIGVGGGGFVQVDESVFDTAKVVMDIITKPRRTPLLEAAEAKGCTVMNGSRMLVLQGVFAFELFTGQKAPVEAMYEAVTKALAG